MAVLDSHVKAVIDTARDTTTFITTAQLFVDEELSGSGHSAARLEQIVLYLAAHFCCLTEEQGGMRRQKLGDSDDSYRVPGDKDTGLAFTRYGQQALILDSSGILAALSTNKGLKATFEVIGDSAIEEDTVADQP